MLWWLPASLVDGNWVPFGNDAFYHARRVLDAVATGGLVREFDPSIHAPEGSLIVWPWAYDSALAALARGVLALSPGTDPFAVVAWVPPLALPFSLALLVSIACRLGAGAGAAALAAASLAMAPPFTGAHLVGAIDHHWAEGAFALAALAAALAWADAPARAGRAVLLGVVLGLAHGVHNGLFVLQLPVLAALLLGWLADRAPPARSAFGFACMLPATTLAVALPSTALQQGQFAYYLLSWFHVAVAAASGLLVLVLSRWPARATGIGIVLALSAATLWLLGRQIVDGTQWAAAELPHLDRIVEAQSLMSLAAAEGLGMLRMQGALPLLLPLLPIAVARLWRAQGAAALLLLAFGAFGCLMYLLQSRFWYLAVGPLGASLAVVASALAGLAPRPRRMAGVLLALVALAPSLLARQLVLAPANQPGYPELRPLLQRLADACRERPGIVLARAGLGHLITYHAPCAVIANHFILTPQQIGKINEAERLLALSPEALLAAEPRVDDLLLTPPSQPPGALEQALLIERRAVPGFESIGLVASRRSDGSLLLEAEAWRLSRPDAAAAVAQ